MSVINVNSFDSRVSNSNFLTRYTDPYLRQSLANLGQRLSVKGDSMSSSKFVMSDLFPNYLGDFNQKDIAVEFTWTKDTNSVKAHIVKINSDGTRTDVGLTSTSSGDANSSFVIKSSDNIIENLTKDDYLSDIYLNDSDSTNGSAYWHRNSARIARLHDASINKDVLIYKIVGHVNNGTFGPYDNEYICEEITVDGDFVDGFRIFMSNEDNLMSQEDKPLSSTSTGGFKNGEYEKLVMMRLHKNKSYDKNNSANSHEWTLDVYKCNDTNNYVELGDVTQGLNEEEDDLWYKLANLNDSYGSLSPEEVINELTTILTEKNYIMTSNGLPLFTKMYSIPVDYNTEDNVDWIVASFSNITNDNRVCDNVGTGNWSNDDYDDHDMIENKLEYFVNDKTQVFPVILSIYDDIMYRGSDSTNIKLKRQIVNQLVLSLFEKSKTDEESISSELITEYNVLFPVDFEINYVVNSNDASIIYNSMNSCTVMFKNIGTDKNASNSVIETLWKISNHNDSNDQIVIANGYSDITMMYDFTINYVNDSIISSISWNPSFILPYIDTTGYWNINGTKTDQYARSNNANSSGIIMSIDDSIDSFNPEESIIFGSDVVKSWDSANWEKKKYAVEYVDPSNNVGGTQTFYMNAWVPSSKWLKTISATDSFSYINNVLFVCSSSMNMEEDVTSINKIYDRSDASDIYKTTYFNNTSYHLYEDTVTGNSYIYTTYTKQNSLTYLLGTDTLVSSFWVCSSYEENGITNYEMTYLKKPGNSNSLDLSYLLSLSNYIQHYAKNQFSPDDYFHKWVVFSKVNSDLKNNTKDTNKSVYPVIRNYNSKFFTSTLASYTKAFGNNANVTLDKNNSYDGKNEQYKNNLNFSIEFDNKVTSYSGHVSDVSNTVDDRHFDINKYVYTYDNPVSYISLDPYGRKIIKVTSEEISKEYGVIPASIPYVHYPNEYIPNAQYSANDESDPTISYQYPGIDFSEVLARNLTTLNRYNIIGVDYKHLGPDNYKTILWNAYFGIGWDGNVDKSHLKIGTSNINPNLGTSTMIHNESQSKLTPIDTLDVDLAYTYFAGDVIVDGHLKGHNSLWIAHYVPSLNTYAYETTTVAIDVNNCHQLGGMEKFDINSKDNDALVNSYSTYKGELLQTISVNASTSLSKRYSSRYYKQYSNNYENDDKNVDDLHYKVSYLNVTKLLENNHVISDFNTVVNGDAIRLTKRIASTNLDDILYFLKIENASRGIFNDMMRTFIDNKNLSGYENTEWGSYLVDNGYDLVELTNKIYSVFEFDNTNNHNKYLSVDNDGFYWSFKDGKDKIKCQKIIGKLTEETTIGYYEYNEVPGDYVRLHDKQYHVNSVGLQHYESGMFLELSTDLTDKENNLYNKDNDYIAVTNPIQISYIDVPNSYTGTFDTLEEKRIYTYMYVEPNDYDEGKGNYDDYYAITNGNSSKYSDKYSYNEIWTCDGCNKCSGFSCNMIKMCKLSKCIGSFKISYGKFVCSDNHNKINDALSYMKQNTKVYQYKHKRYGEREDGSSYVYWSYCYYPTYESIYVGNQGVDAVTLTYDNNGVPATVLDANQNVVEYNNDVQLASYVYIGSNILCMTQEQYTSSYANLLEKNSNYSYERNSSIISIKYEDNPTIINLVHDEDRYWKLKNAYMVDGNNYDGWSHTIKNNIPNEYSFNGDVTITHDYGLSKRYVNVREVLTNNTIPQFYDEGKSFYEVPINIPSNLIPNDPTYSEDIDKEPITQLPEPVVTRKRYCYISDSNGNKIENNKVVLYNVDWSNASNLDNGSLNGSGEFYIVCYDEKLTTNYSWIDANNHNKGYSLNHNPSKTEIIEVSPKIDQSELEKYNYKFSKNAYNISKHIYKFSSSIDTNTLKRIKTSIDNLHVYISNNDTNVIELICSGKYVGKETVSYKLDEPKNLTVLSSNHEYELDIPYDIDENSYYSFDFKSYVITYKDFVEKQRQDVQSYINKTTLVDVSRSYVGKYFKLTPRAIQYGSITNWVYDITLTDNAKDKTENISETVKITQDNNNNWFTVKIVRLPKQ